MSEAKKIKYAAQVLQGKSMCMNWRHGTRSCLNLQALAAMLQGVGTARPRQEGRWTAGLE